MGIIHILASGVTSDCLTLTRMVMSETNLNKIESPLAIF